MFFSDNNKSYRSIKALNSFAQMALTIFIICAIMGPEGIEAADKAALVAFFVMRIVQPIMNFLQNCASRSGKMTVVMIGILYLVLFIACQVGIALNLTRLNHELLLRNTMAEVALG